MFGSSSAPSYVALVFSVGIMGCGLRSDPIDGGDQWLDDGGSTPANPDRAGTCSDPFSIPFNPTTLRGELKSGPSNVDGWCAGDQGPEDVYMLVVDYDIDVTLSLNDNETEFSPTVRVIEDGCENGSGAAKICTGNLGAQPYHFLAQAGREYSIVIDSPQENAVGKYAVNVGFDPPTIDQCGLHPEVIAQIRGTSFLWNNEFSRGQGRVDSYCPAPGRENMFLLSMIEPGAIDVEVQGGGELYPVISLRKGCGALEELSCESAQSGQRARLSTFIAEPGAYYLVVDNGGIDRGRYALRVDFN